MNLWPDTDTEPMGFLKDTRGAFLMKGICAHKPPHSVSKTHNPPITDSSKHRLNNSPCQRQYHSHLCKSSC